MKISVIIPTLNEAENLAMVLAALGQREKRGNEVIVVDGGSEDETGSIAKQRGVKVINCSPAGRARQMNRGAEESQGDVLFFLHGDTVVPDGALDLIADVCRNSSVVGGGFIREFDSDSQWLRWTCRLADWRSERGGVFLGDQGIFVRRDVFEKLGGYDETLQRCEDLQFSMKMRERGKVVALRPAVISSARRFEKLGPVGTTLRDGWWTVKHLLRK